MDAVEKLRTLVAEELLPSSTLGVALTNIADEFEAQTRGLAAAIERIERLEARWLHEDGAAIERRDAAVISAVHAAKAARP